MMDIKTVGLRGEYFSQSVNREQRRHLEKMQRRARDIANSAYPGMRLTPTEQDEERVRSGRAHYSICQSPEDRSVLLGAMLQQAEKTGKAEALYALHFDDCAMSTEWCSAVWAKCAFPYVSIADDKFAASLMATSVPPELAKAIVPPWKAFRVAIPAGLLSIDNDADPQHPEPCQRLMVSYINDEWTIVCEGRSLLMHIAGQSTEHLCEDVDVEKTNMCDAEDMQLTGRDGRVFRIASRLVLGICLYFDSYQQIPLKNKRLRGKNRGVSGDPAIRQYVIGRPVKVDARKAVREYVESGARGSSVSVQILVRGHWKNQPCGHQASERKFIHIEPYWRGPEDAPIAVRPHLLNGVGTNG